MGHLRSVKAWAHSGLEADNSNLFRRKSRVPKNRKLFQGTGSSPGLVLPSSLPGKKKKKKNEFKFPLSFHQDLWESSAPHRKDTRFPNVLFFSTRDPPASASVMLGLKVCHVQSSFITSIWFLKILYFSWDFFSLIRSILSLISLTKFLAVAAKRLSANSALVSIDIFSS